MRSLWNCDSWWFVSWNVWNKCDPKYCNPFAQFHLRIAFAISRNLCRGCIPRLDVIWYLQTDPTRAILTPVFSLWINWCLISFAVVRLPNTSRCLFHNLRHKSTEQFQNNRQAQFGGNDVHYRLNWRHFPRFSVISRVWSCCSVTQHFFWDHFTFHPWTSEIHITCQATDWGHSVDRDRCQIIFVIGSGRFHLIFSGPPTVSEISPVILWFIFGERIWIYLG
jgi:hypothetical protein